MLNPVGLVSISLGSVVLDRPDETGRFIAKDLAGGWAYMVTDADGDNRFRGQGVCDGGLDQTLRCAFLAAANRIPEYQQIRILVETRQAHRVMVQFAVNDSHVVAAIGGRPVSILTRPDARASFLVRTAAERAASNALRDREHAEWRTSATADTGVPSVNGIDGATDPRTTDDESAAKLTPEPLSDWRARLSLDPARRSAVKANLDLPKQKKKRPSKKAFPSVGRLINPLLKKAHDGLAAAGVGSAQRTLRNENVQTWLREFDNHVTAVTGDLEEVGV